MAPQDSFHDLPYWRHYFEFVCWGRCLVLL